MTVYAPSDMRGITIPQESGGCGHQHTIAPDSDERLSVTCAKCEPVLLKMRGHGWATDPMHVALTPDERRAADAAASRAKVEQEKTWSSPHAFAAFMKEAGFTGPDTPDSGSASAAVLKQMRAMQQQINDLTAKLAEKEAATDSGDGATEAAKATPAKRGGRKAAAKPDDDTPPAS